MASKKQMKLLTESHMSNMGKKGSVPASREKVKDDGVKFGPMLLAFFLFVVLGSAIFQILQVLEKPSQ